MQAAVLAVLAFAVHVQAYIPAVPTNNTNAVNQTDMSMVTMKWAPAGTYSNIISYQLASSDSDGFEQVRYMELGLGRDRCKLDFVRVRSYVSPRRA
jgi:hypothetical protein